MSGALVTLHLQGGTSEGPVQENDTSKDVFWNNNSVSGRVDRLEAQNPPGGLLQWPRSNRKRAGMGAVGLGTRGSTQGAYGAELPGRAGYGDSAGPGLPSGSEAQTDENASHRDGEVGERSTLREDYNSVLDKMRYDAGDTSVEMSSRQLHIPIRSRKKF